MLLAALFAVYTNILVKSEIFQFVCKVARFKVSQVEALACL